VISSLIADEMAIGVFNNKTTAVRIIPVPGAQAGDRVEYGVYWAALPSCGSADCPPAGLSRAADACPLRSTV
jgi:hypothetical protein